MRSVLLEMETLKPPRVSVCLALLDGVLSRAVFVPSALLDRTPTQEDFARTVNQDSLPLLVVFASLAIPDPVLFREELVSSVLRDSSRTLEVSASPVTLDSLVLLVLATVLNAALERLLFLVGSVWTFAHSV